MSRPLKCLVVLLILSFALQPAVSASAAPAARPSPIVQEAFETLMGAYVTPPRSADLLNAGWSAALELLHAQGAEPTAIQRPSLAGDPDADWRAFAAAYPRLLDGAGGKVGRVPLERAIIRGMAASFKSAGTWYFLPDESPVYKAELQNGDVGLRLSPSLEVIETLPDSPAEAAGIRPADRLLSIDGSPANQVQDHLRGVAGTPVALTLRRPDGSDPVTLSLVRVRPSWPWVEGRMLDDGLGYLRIRAFPEPAEMDRFEQALARLAAANPRGLIVDLCGGAGGSYDTLLQVASRLIRQGAVFQQINRTGQPLVIPTLGRHWGRDLSIHVLVDGGTSGASELLAAALRESAAGRVFGTRTAGQLSESTVFPFGDGSGLVVTTLVLRSGRGQSLDGVGLEPDRTVELDLMQRRAGRDTQLAAALDELRGASRSDTK